MSITNAIKELFPETREIHTFTSGANENTFRLRMNGVYRVLKFDIDSEIYETIVPRLNTLGVHTPEVYEIGKHNGRDYVLMEYLEGTKLNRDPRPETFTELGKIMKDLHKIKGSGFGKIQEDTSNDGPVRGQFTDLSEYIKKKFLKNVTYELETVDHHLEKIARQYEDCPSVFCHMDLSTSNTIARDGKIYMIDFGNDAGLNYGLFDVAKSIINDSRFVTVYEGYKKSYGFDPVILESFVYIIGLRKIASWRRRGKGERVDLLKKLFPAVIFE